jgi:membrane protease YdiL (CAAX protease family)
LPAIAWSYGQTWWGVLIGFLAGFLLAPALVLPFDPDLDSDAGLLVAQGLLGGTLIGVSVGVATHWRFSPLRQALGQLGIRRFAPSALGWMLLALFAYYVFAGLFASLVLEPQQDDIGEELGVGGENILVAVLAVILIAGLAPVAEELFFRGFIFAGFRSRFSFWPAALIGGALFGVVHVATGPTAAIPLAVLGVALCWLYERTGSLWPCIFAHMINNGLALLILGLD